MNEEIHNPIKAVTESNSNFDSLLSNLRRNERIALASACPMPPDELLQQHLANLNNCIDCLAKRTEKYVKKSMEIMSKRSGNGIKRDVDGPESRALYYPWWLVFVAGPFQSVDNSFHIRCFPQKSIQSGFAFFWCFLWRNPAPIDWVKGLPTAAEMMKDKTYNVCAELFNLTQVCQGPEIDVKTIFSNGSCLDANLFVFNFPAPNLKKRVIYELNVTVEMTEVGLPLVAFANFINDLSSEPSFLFEPNNSHHLFQETPLRFVVY